MNLQLEDAITLSRTETTFKLISTDFSVVYNLIYSTIGTFIF